MRCSVFNGNISTRFLIPKQLKNNGLSKDELTLTGAAIVDLIRYYTKEAGVRGLEREVARICRKVVKQAAASTEQISLEIDSDELETFSGVRRYSFGRAEVEDQVGQVTGLAVTSI